MRLVLEEGLQLYQYTPRSDFSFVINNFPVFLLAVSSDRSKGDNRCHLQLQASCLVRLGNALMASPEFVIKAIYVDNDYQATEYTFFQRDHKVFVSLTVMLNDQLTML